MRTWPPMERPYSAGKADVRIWISATASISAAPIAVPSAPRVRRPTAPSVVTVLSEERVPLMLAMFAMPNPPPVTDWPVTPGFSSARYIGLRPVT